MIPCENCPHKLNPSQNKHFCCGIIPFPTKFLEEHKKDFKSSGELQENGEQGVIITPDFLCVFFDRVKHNCAIYEDRPAVCRLYGIDEERLPCPYFRRSGNPRTEASKKITLRKITEIVDKATTPTSKLIKRERLVRKENSGSQTQENS